MKTQVLTLIASVLLLAGGPGAAWAQQGPPDDRPMMQEDQRGQGTMGPGMMGQGMGMTPEMMQMMRDRQAGMGGGMMRGRGFRSGMMGHGGMMQIMFAIMDADASGALSLSEIQDIHARIFKHIDADKDDQVTMEEIRTFFRGGEPPAASRQ